MMGWREWPNWVKGGATLAVIHVVLYLATYLFAYLPRMTMDNADLVFIPFTILDFVVTFLLNLSVPINIGFISTFLVWGTLQWFLIGALMGWIMGKVRGKKAATVE